MTRSRLIPLGLTLGLLLVLAGCAAGINPYVGEVSPDTAIVANFWRGLWHGIIAPITFIISLFTDDVSIYEVYNNGGWYDFGFVLGSGILFGGGIFGIFRGARRWD